MRIGLSDAASELPVAHGTDRGGSAQQGSGVASAGFPKDTTEISATAAASSGSAAALDAGLKGNPQVADLVQQALAVGSARASRVSELRDSVTSGQYRVTPEQIAAALLRETK